MALGMIEMFGYTTAIVAADKAAKAGDVTIVAIDAVVFGICYAYARIAERT